MKMESTKMFHPPQFRGGETSTHLQNSLSLAYAVLLLVSSIHVPML